LNRTQVHNITQKISQTLKYQKSIPSDLEEDRLSRTRLPLQEVSVRADMSLKLVLSLLKSRISLGGLFQKQEDLAKRK